jgi:hypothetical protein
MQRGYLYKVIAKDSVLLGDNYRLKLRLSYGNSTPSEKEDWIDEMGSTVGLIFSGITMHNHIGFVLVCFYRSGEFLYRSAFFPACDSIPVSREEKQSARPILLAPNPFSERAIVRLPPEIAFQQGLLYILR